LAFARTGISKATTTATRKTSKKDIAGACNVSFVVVVVVVVVVILSLSSIPSNLVVLPLQYRR
jgi:hypothetical protein